MTERVRVGDVLALQRRAVRVDPGREYEEIGVRSFGKGIFHKESVRGMELGNKRVFHIQPGDLVVSNVFAWEGAIALASDADAGKIGSHRFMTFTPRDDRLDPSWATWFFLSEPGLALIRKASPGSAGRNRTLAVERFENLELPLLPMTEQRRAASRLNCLRDSIRALEDAVDQATRFAQSLIASVTSRHDMDEASKAHAGWRRVPLSEVLIQRPPDVSIQVDASYMVAGLYSFGRGLIDRGTISGSETSYRSMRSLSDGDIVMSKLNGWEGAVAVVPAAFAGYCVSSEYPVFRADPVRLVTGYFDGIARSPWFWDALNRNARGSMVRRRRINADQLLDTEVWLPPIEAQARIAGQLRVIRRVEELQAVARARRDALIPAALNEAFSQFN